MRTDEIISFTSQPLAVEEGGQRGDWGAGTDPTRMLTLGSSCFRRTERCSARPSDNGVVIVVFVSSIILPEAGQPDTTTTGGVQRRTVAWRGETARGGAPAALWVGLLRLHAACLGNGPPLMYSHVK